MTSFYDMNGVAINVGDYCEPIEGRRVEIVDMEYDNELADYVLIGRQVRDPMAFSKLTKDDLATYFTRVEL
jgi:hypothetical protein